MMNFTDEILEVFRMQVQFLIRNWGDEEIKKNPQVLDSIKRNAMQMIAQDMNLSIKEVSRLIHEASYDKREEHNV